MDEVRTAPAALVSDLLEVVATLDPPGTAPTDLIEMLQAFYREAALAVRPLIGMSLIYRLAGRECVLTGLQPDRAAEDVAASLQISASPNGADCFFVLYADEAAAFADLAGALAADLGSAADLLLVDQHLQLPSGSDLSAFQEATLQDMAEGVLLGRGFTEVGATTFLQSLAGADGGDAAGAARQVIRSVR